MKVNTAVGLCVLTVESKVGQGTQFIARLPFRIPERPGADPRENTSVDL